MFIPFFSSHIDVKEESDKISVRANFGTSFKYKFRTMIGHEKKLNALLLGFGMTELTFYKFFKNEIIAILQELLTVKDPRGLNLKSISDVIESLKNLNKQNEDFKLDYKAVENRFKFKILPHQEKIFEQYEFFKKNYHYRGMLVDADPGTGKAQPLTAKIRTPGGWITMGEVKEGDVIYNWKLEPVTVLKTFPQGKKDIYKITLEDGRHTECCYEHLWEVIKDNQSEVKPLEEILKDYQEVDYFIKMIPNQYLNPMDKEDPELLKLQKILQNENQVTINVVSRNASKVITRLVRKFGGYCKLTPEKHSDKLEIDFSKDKLKIINIEHVGEKEAKCILIDDVDHLYITDDYIVTHNTFSSLALSTALKSNLTIIICPLPTLKEVWIDSISSDSAKCVFKDPQKVYIVRDNKPYQNEEFILCHYEGLDKLKELLTTMNNLNEVCYIIDESHNLAEQTSKRTTLALDCLNYIVTKAILQPNVILLSGTPLKAKFTEMLNISSFIDPYLTPQVSTKFVNFYKSPNALLSELLTQRYKGYSVKVKKDSIKLEPVITKYIPIKLANGSEFTIKEIRKELREYINKRLNELKSKHDFYRESYYNLKDRALLLLNKKPNDRDVIEYEDNFRKIMRASPGELTTMPHIMKSVNDFENQLLSVLRGDDKKLFSDAKSILKYPELKVQGEALGLIITGKRIQCHLEMAKQLKFADLVDSTLKKTVVFSNYVNVCQAAFDKCRDENYNPIGVYGEKVKNLDSSVKAFMNDKVTNPIIATYKALSTGVPLIAGNVVICVDLPFRMYVYDQAISRVWRLGQDQQVYIYILSLDTGEEPNINSRNIDIIAFFKEEVEKITGYKANLELDRTLNASMESLDYDPKDVLKIKLPEDVDTGIFKLWS